MNPGAVSLGIMHKTLEHGCHCLFLPLLYVALAAPYVIVSRYVGRCQCDVKQGPCRA